MLKKFISTGSTFEKQIGYSRAVIQDNWIFVSGTTGYNYKTMFISEDVVQQAEQCLINIKSTLEKAQASMSDIVRVTYILPNPSDFELCWPVFKKYLGHVKPVATMISAGLANEKLKIEIEVTALKTK